MSLLSKAKKETATKGKTTTEEEMELAIAWARGEVSLKQASAAWTEETGNKHGMSIYLVFARGLRKFIQDNKI